MKTSASAPQLAIAWVLRQKDLTAAIVGARCVDHVAEIVKAGELVMAKENLLEIEAILADHRAERREVLTPYITRVVSRILNFLTTLCHGKICPGRADDVHSRRIPSGQAGKNGDPLPRFPTVSKYQQ